MYIFAYHLDGRPQSMQSDTQAMQQTTSSFFTKRNENVIANIYSSRMTQRY